MRVEVATYETESQAIRMLRKLSPEIQFQMAEAYRAAFAGDPWEEKYICPSCGRYLKNSFCPKCQVSSSQEAYPINELLNDYFPEMLSAFVPGMLGIAIESSQVAGFTTGGFTVLENLIYNKYVSENPKRILNSISSSANISPNELVFYDNETCILPSLQGQGLGKVLSLARIKAALKMRAEIICGRTINVPWLGLKERQLTQARYNFTYLVPDGESYQVDGMPRYFYLAIKQDRIKL